MEELKNGATPAELMAATNRKNSFMIYNGMTLTQLSKERAVVVLLPNEHSLNPLGNVHGGALFTLADCASGALSRAVGNGIYVTLGGNLNFVKGVSTGEISATATLLHGGRSTIVVNVDICNAQNALLAQGSFTFFRTGDLPG